MRAGFGVIGVLAIFAAFKPAPIIAAPVNIRTGNDFLEICSDGDSLLSQGLCLGFITGLLSRDKLAGAITVGAQIVCVPAGVTNRQLIDIALAYLRNHPDKRHYEGGQLAMAAWEEAFRSNRQACVQKP